MSVAAVVIGRNEGERLIRCLTSLKPSLETIVYVDSGSTDGSVEAALAVGAQVLTLDMARPFTAARARNAGMKHLLALDRVPEYIQFLDGDCELVSDWIETALAFLNTNPDVGVVCGRRRERHPQATIYNALVDREWDTSVGLTDACGGDALMRSTALQAVGGYNPSLIAGEEPELCLRLRRAGWQIWRLDAEMTFHDANITRFAQWWQRSCRAGYAYAEGAFLHGASQEGHYVRQTRRAVIWGGGVPLATALGLLVSPWALMLLLLWPLQVLRLAMRGHPWIEALFLTLSKLPETQGIFRFHLARLRGVKSQLIEYK